MADPLTMGTVAVGAGSSIFGSLLGAKGAQRSAQSQSDQMYYQAGLAMFNAQIAEQNANYAQQQGEMQAAKYGLGARQQQANIRAGQSAFGLDVNTGSAKEVQDSQHSLSRQDMDSIRMNAAKTAYDYRTQAAADQAEAAGDVVGAIKAKEAGRINVLGSLIGGASSVADKWFKAKEVGMFKGIPVLGG